MDENALVEINNSLQEYLKKGFHVPGSTVITRTVDFMQPSIRIVQIDPDPKKSEVYAVSGGKFAFGRPAIQKFADAGRIELRLPPNPVSVEKGKGIERYTARAIGERYELDGSPKRLEDAKTLDLVIREEEMRLKYEEKAEQEHRNWSADQKRAYVDKCVRKIMIEKRKFATESAITGAQARVVQKLLGLKPVYTMDELRKPFVIVSVTPVVDMNDPDIKRMVTAHMLGITQELYPHSSQGSSYIPRTPETIDVSDKDIDVDIEPSDIMGGDRSRGWAEPVRAQGDDGFEEYPRNVRENVVLSLVKDESTSAKVRDMEDAELNNYYRKLRAA